MEILYLNPTTHTYETRDWAWLTATFGPGLRFLDGGSGQKFRLYKIVVTEAEASVNIHVMNEQGGPQVGQPAACAWPDMTLGGSIQQIRQNGQNLGGLKTCYADRACIQNIDANGQTGYGMSTSWYIQDMQTGGPGIAWVLSPSLPSDGLAGIGMIGGTVHLAPTHLYFQIGQDSTIPVDPPATGTVRAHLQAAQAEIAAALALLDNAKPTLDEVAQALQLLG